MNGLLRYLVWIIIIAPLVYLGVVWKELPEIVPMHYSIDGQIDRYGNKKELFIVMLIMTVVNIFVYLLTSNIHRIDPKKRNTAENLPRMRRLAFGVAVFLSCIGFFIIHSSLQQSVSINASYILAATGLLFSFIGNYMYNIKQNYFAGMRLPWTLESEENWKKTHLLSGKLWFGGGIIIALLCVSLPAKAAFIAFSVGAGILVIVPIIYSYQLYKKEKRR